MEFLRAEDGGTDATEQWLESRVKRYGARSLFLPAGETPRPLYARWREAEPGYLRGLRLLQVDDVSTGREKGMFARFFREELPALAVEPPVSEVKADLAILGLGTNGHVAFHEPGIPASFRFGEVDLAEDTAARLKLEPGTKGVTYGVGTFFEAKAILLVVRGQNKKEILERLRKGDPSLPASGLLNHPDLTVLTDL
jgi:6-phosphogluconolactonase/glucosamine-6-phosphate isomerase/deaminase